MNSRHHNMNANASRSGLIFVTNITVYIRGGKIVMWRNFSFPSMTIVGKLQCYLHVETFWEMLGNFATIYALLCGEKLSPKVHLWKTNDKYEVWLMMVFIILFFISHFLEFHYHFWSSNQLIKLQIYSTVHFEGDIIYKNTFHVWIKREF